MNWKDIRQSLAALCFVDDEEFNAVYLSHARHAVNAAFCDLAKSVYPLCKRLKISHVPQKNVVENFSQGQVISGSFSVFASGAATYYFECNGRATVFLEKEESGSFTVLKEIRTSGCAGYEIYRGFVGFSGRIRLRFEGQTPFRTRSVALYAAASSELESDILPPRDVVEYNLSELTKNQSGMEFLCFDTSLPVLRDGKPEWNFGYASGGRLMLPSWASGEYEVEYNAYPAKITAQTTDGDECDMCDAAVQTGLLYAASILLSDDDPQKSVQYYNEYITQKMQTYTDRPSPCVWAGSEEW